MSEPETPRYHIRRITRRQTDEGALSNATCWVESAWTALCSQG